jgi:Mrp family chromosome partitioning ATPase
MARILDAFRPSESNGVRLAGSTPASETTHQDWDPEEESDVPFIEVGGPEGSVASSGDARRTRPAEPRPAAPAFRTFIPADEPAALAPSTADDVVVQVSFRPLPAPPLPMRPACERLAAELIAFHQPEHPVSEQYRTLLAGIDAQLATGKRHVVLLTAPSPGAGTTTALLNLALTRALQDGSRVAVVDVNFSSPAVANRLGLDSTPGLREVLEGSVSPPRALRETGVLHLHALTAGRARVPESATLRGEALSNLLGELRHRFDSIFVDAPCWDGRPELTALAGLCDAVYLVVPQTASELGSVRELMELIPRQGGRLRGCIYTQR